MGGGREEKLKVEVNFVFSSVLTFMTKKKKKYGNADAANQHCHKEELLCIRNQERRRRKIQVKQ